MLSIRFGANIDCRPYHLVLILRVLYGANAYCLVLMLSILFGANIDCRPYFLLLMLSVPFGANAECTV